MDTRERTLLEIIANHVEITEQFLDHYAKLAVAVQLQPGIRQYLPLELPSKVRDMHAASQTLLMKVRSILRQK